MNASTFNFQDVQRVIAPVLPDFEFSYDDLDNLEIKQGYKVQVGMTYKYDTDCYVCLEIECSTKFLDVEIEFNNSRSRNPEFDDYYTVQAECPDLYTPKQVIAKVTDSHNVAIEKSSMIELTETQRRDLMLTIEEMVFSQTRDEEAA